MPVGEQATKLTLAALYLGGLLDVVGAAAAAGRAGARGAEPFDLVLLGLASYRTGRLVAYERVAAPLREPSK